MRSADSGRQHRGTRPSGQTIGLTLAFALALTACGGGSGSDSTDTGGGAAPSIVSQPLSLTVSAGQSASFSVDASGSGALSYQWLLNGNEIAGATASTYRIASVSSSDDGANLSVRVTNGSGSIVSNVATLSVTSTSGDLNAVSVRLSTATGHALAVRADGSVVAWGGAMSAGSGTVIAGSTARVISGVGGAAGVHADTDRAVVVTASGSVLGWGDNGQGALGQPYTGSSSTLTSATAVAQLSGVVQALSCNTTLYALRSDGSVWLTPGTRTNAGVVAARAVSGLGGVRALVQVSRAQANFGCDLLALDSNGKAWRVTARRGDYDTSSQTYTWQATVTQDQHVPADTRLLACDRRIFDNDSNGHCLAMTSDGALWSWGQNNAGQLGLGDQVDRTIATQFATGTGIRKLQAGGNYSFALGEDGTVYGWGGMSPGASDAMFLGRSGESRVDWSDFWVAGALPGITDVADLVIEDWGRYAIAVKTDGSVWAWGNNDSGVFGDGTSGTYSAVPVRVLGVSLN